MICVSIGQSGLKSVLTMICLMSRTIYVFVVSNWPKIMSKIGRLGVRKRRKSIPPAYHTLKNRTTGVRTPNSKILTEALHRIKPQGQHCSKIMKPPQSLPLQMVERLLRAQPDSVANHVTAHSISD